MINNNNNNNLDKALQLYTPDEIYDMIFDSLAPAHCEKCGEVITDAEQDASWIGGGDLIECFNCGPGTRITSAILLF